MAMKIPPVVVAPRREIYPETIAGLPAHSSADDQRFSAVTPPVIGTAIASDHRPVIIEIQPEFDAGADADGISHVDCPMMIRFAFVEIEYVSLGRYEEPVAARQDKHERALNILGA